MIFNKIALLISLSKLDYLENNVRLHFHMIMFF